MTHTIRTEGQRAAELQTGLERASKPEQPKHALRSKPTDQDRSGKYNQELHTGIEINAQRRALQPEAVHVLNGVDDVSGP